MKDSDSQDARRLADHLRRDVRFGGHHDIEQVLEAARQLDIELTRTVWDEITRSSQRERHLPDQVKSFLVMLAESRHPSGVVDLWCGEGALANALGSALPEARIAAVDPSHDAIAVAQHFGKQSNVEWVLGRPRDAWESAALRDKRIDLLISTAPFGTQIEHFEQRLADGRQVLVGDEAGRVDLVQYAPAVSSEGAAVLVTTASILWSERSKKLLDALRACGLWMESAISIPAGTYPQTASIPMVVVLFSRVPRTDVFAAELPRTPDGQRRLLENMAARRIGKNPQAGVLLAADALAPLESIVIRGEVERGLAATGIGVVTLGDVVLRLNKPVDRTGGLTFEEEANSFYMPLIGFGDARMELPDKISREWVQVVLDPDKAIAAHTARWLSSPLGRRAREAEATGTSIPRTKTDTLLALRIPLPALSEQDQAVSLDAQLVALTAELSQMREDLWARPHRLRNVSRRVRRLTPDDDIPSWIDSLPLPLATVGRAYYARQDTRARIDALFNFFEAMAEFHAVVLLSGIASDESYFKQAQEDLLGSSADRRRYYAVAGMGNWTAMTLRLSKELNRLRDHPDSEKAIGKETVQRWFGRPDHEWLDMMTSKALYTTLEEATRRRNEWKAHSGAAGEAINRERLAELEIILASVRAVVADRWDTAKLISPGPFVLNNGTLETTVDVLVGSGLPLRQERVTTTDALDSAYLYVIHGEGPSALKLLPLIRMMPSPSSANVACYFYNRVEGEGLKYVSYYFEEAPEATVSGAEAATDAVLHALGLSD